MSVILLHLHYFIFSQCVLLTLSSRTTFLTSVAPEVFHYRTNLQKIKEVHTVYNYFFLIE